MKYSYYDQHKKMLYVYIYYAKIKTLHSDGHNTYYKVSLTKYPISVS